MATSSSLDSFCLRPATDADAPQVQELVFGILRAYGLQPDPQGTDADLTRLEAFYHPEAGGSFHVAVDAAGRLVGTVGLLRLEAQPGAWELRKMYVHPAARGRGLGGRLLDLALEQVRERGGTELYLETAQVLKEAVALYEKRGFTRCGALPGHACASRCDTVMKRVLAREEPAAEAVSLA